MISSVTDSTQTASTTAASTSSSTAEATNVSEVNTPFGQLFVENLNSGDPVVVGFNYGYGLQGTSGDCAVSSTSTSSSSDTSSSSSTPLVSALSTPAASTSSSSTSSSTSTSSSSSSTSSSDPIITGVDSDDPTYVPTAQSVFGDSPWETDVVGTGPSGNFTLNPQYFATESTAQEVAAMVGGTVVSVNTMAQCSGNPFKQSEDNEMVELSNGCMINAGLVAGFFNNGYDLSQISRMIQNEVTNVEKEDQGVSTT